MKTKLLPMLAAALILPTLAACGNGPTASDGSATGTWDGTESFPAQNGTTAQNYPIRYVVTDNSGTLTGSVYFCNDTAFNCNPTNLTGSRSGNSLTLNYYDANNVLIKTTGTFTGHSFSGSTQYVDGATFNGTTTLTRK